MAIDATSESRRSTSACHRKLCDRFGWPTTPHGRRRSRNVHAWPVGACRHWCVALFAIGGRASAAERLTKVATRLFLVPLRPGIGRTEHGGRNNHDVDLQFL